MAREEVKQEEEERRGWERGVNQCLSLKPRDHFRLTPAVARAVREGFNRDAAFICSHLAGVEFIAFAEGPAKSQGVT